MNEMYYLGQIVIFPYNFEPRDFKKCDGRLVSVEKWVALYSLLGTRFGGDGRVDFCIPKIEDPCNGVSYYICMNGQYPPRD